MNQIIHTDGYLDYRFAPGGTCEIVNIEVDEKRRRQGVGGKLVRMVSEEAKCNGCGRLYALTRLSNVIAQRFYEHHGFRVSGILRNFYTVDGDAVCYVRDL